MSKKLTDDELLAQFDDLEGEVQPTAPAPRPAKPTRASKPAAQLPTKDDEDPLAELEDLAKGAQRGSRPSTPKLPSSSTTSRNRSPKRGGIVTPSSTASARTSEDKPQVPLVSRRSGESTAPLPTLAAAEPKQEQQGGGWWGGIFATASAAVKQAEAAVKEIQKNEEAQRWAERVKGNVGALRGIGRIG